MNNTCPDCKKTYDKKPTRCVCGWYLVSENKANISKFICHFMEFEKKCEDPGTVALSPHDTEWFCGPHAERVRNDRYQKLIRGNGDEK
jgi:hypothetical protein